MPEPTEAISPEGATPAPSVDPVAEGNAAGHQTDATDAAAQQQSDAPSGPDLSFLDDELRNKLADHLDAEAVEMLRKGYSRLDYMTRKRQEEAEVVRTAKTEAERYKDAADKWEALVSDPAKRQAVLSIFDGSAATVESAPEIPEDLFARDPQSFADTMAEYIRAKLAPDIRPVDAESIKREIMEAQTAPIMHAQKLAGAAEEFGISHGLDQNVVDAACRQMTQDHEGAANLTPEQVSRLLPTYVRAIEFQSKSETAAREAQSTLRAQEQARAASPRGGSGVSVGSGADLASALKAAQEKAGRSLSFEEQTKLAYRNMMERASTATGKPSSELEAELSKDPWAFRAQ